MVFGLALAVTGASCGGEAALPGQPGRTTVTMHEYRFQVEPPAPNGRVVLDVRNLGGLEHEMTLVKLPEDFPPIAEQARGGPARNAPTVASVRRRPGAVTSLAVDLTPGRYGMVCFVADADGVQHYRKGMAAEFVVS